MIKVVFVLSLWFVVSLGGDTNDFCDGPIEIGDWFPLADMPNPHRESGMAVIGNEIIVIAGFTPPGLSVNNLTDIYTPETNTWRSGAQAPFAGSHNQFATDGERYIYISGSFIGNNPGTPTNASHRYDHLTDSWSSLPDLPEHRGSNALTYDPVTRRIHNFGGVYDRISANPTHYALDVDNSTAEWQLLPQNFPVVRNHFQGAYLDGFIYAPAGQIGHDNGNSETDVHHRFDVVMEEWEERASLPMVMSHHEPCTLPVLGHIMIFGGSDDTVIMDYNPMTDQWNTLSKTVPAPVLSPVAAFFKNITVLGETNDYIIYSCAWTSAACSLGTWGAVVSCGGNTTSSQSPSSSPSSSSMLSNSSISNSIESSSEEGDGDDAPIVGIGLAIACCACVIIFIVIAVIVIIIIDVLKKHNM